MQPYVLNWKILSNSWSRLKPRPEIAVNFSFPDIRLHRIIIICSYIIIYSIVISQYENYLIYLAHKLILYSFENSKFLNAPYHHQGSSWTWLLIHLIRHSTTKFLIYHKCILLKFWFVDLLSLQTSSMHRIIIKGLHDTGYMFTWFLL